MNKYVVTVMEIHQIDIEVNAYDEGHAIKKAENGEGIWNNNSIEFVQTADTETWVVKVIDEPNDEVPNANG